jgi:hypothetical protein
MGVCSFLIIIFFGGRTPNLRKFSARDLPLAHAQRLSGGTTVAGTLAACALAGIRCVRGGGWQWRGGSGTVGKRGGWRSVWCKNGRDWRDAERDTPRYRYRCFFFDFGGSFFFFFLIFFLPLCEAGIGDVASSCGIDGGSGGVAVGPLDRGG